MWPAVVPATTASLLWLLAAALIFSLLGSDASPFGARLVAFVRRGQRPLLLLVLLALGVRLVPMLLLPVGAGYDIESFQLVAEALLRGEDVYQASGGRHPYLPLQMYWLGTALGLAQHGPLPFVVWIKLPAVLADVAITAVVYRAALGLEMGQATAVRLALLYAFNPVTLAIAAYHGQFDAVTVLLLLLAWAAWQFGRRLGASSTALGFAVLSKTWPIVFLPVALMRTPGWRRRVGYTAVALGIPLLSVTLYALIFQTAPWPMLRRALTHTGVPGYWGSSALLAVGEQVSPALAPVYAGLLAARRWLLLGTGLLALWLTRRQSALNALVTIVLLEFLVTVGMGIQWLGWVIPFALLLREVPWVRRYTLAALVLVVAQLFGLHLYPWAFEWLGRDGGTLLIQLASLPAWLVVAGWCIARLRALRFAAAAG